MAPGATGGSRLTPHLHTSRVRRVREALDDLDADILVLSDPTDVRWLTGYDGSNGFVAIGREHGLFLTDSRYALAPAAVAAATGLQARVGERDTLAHLVRSMAEVDGSARRVAFDGDRISHSEFARLSLLVGDSLELTAVSSPVALLRSIKDAVELGDLEEASQVLDEIFAWIASEGLVGRRERVVAWEIEQRIRQAGFPAVAFSPIVASGPNGSSPHVEPTEREIGRSELVVIDIGARGRLGMCSDATRTFCTGPLPPEAVSDYELVRATQARCVAATLVGAVSGELHDLAQGLLDEGGRGGYFGHALAHSVGLDVHEWPIARPGETAVLEAGMVLTIEPGVYLPGAWGIRIEDAVVVGQDGPRPLTSFSRELVDVG